MTFEPSVKAYDLKIHTVRPNGPTISFKVKLPSHTDIEYFIHPKCIPMHAIDTSFSCMVMKDELIPLTENKIEYSFNITTLKSNQHYTLKLDLYSMVDMIQEYEFMSNFISPSTINFVTQDQYYWICCAQCRCYGGLTTYNKIDDAVFRFIASFCADFSFYGTSNRTIISENGLNVHSIPCYADCDASILFGDFLYSKDERKFRTVFELQQNIDNCIGFGFVTPEMEINEDFDDEFSANHGCIVRNKIAHFGKDFKPLLNEMNVEFADLECSTYVTVIVDMKKQIGSVYFSHNATTPALKVALPEYVAVVVSFKSKKTQKISVKECGFVI